MKVEVNNIPIYHDGTLYEQGASFSLPDDQYERLKEHVTVLDETDDESASTAVDKAIDDMTVAELKAYAAEKQIDLGDATKKEDILAKIKASSE